MVSVQIRKGVPAKGDHIRHGSKCERGGQENEGKKMFFRIYKSKELILNYPVMYQNTLISHLCNTIFWISA